MQKKEIKEEVNNEVLWLENGLWVCPEFIEKERKVIKYYRDAMDKAILAEFKEIIAEERLKRNKDNK
jgi:hypothetical protein